MTIRERKKKQRTARKLSSCNSCPIIFTQVALKVSQAKPLNIWTHRFQALTTICLPTLTASRKFILFRRFTKISKTLSLCSSLKPKARDKLARTPLAAPFSIPPTSLKMLKSPLHFNRMELTPNKLKRLKLPQTHSHASRNNPCLVNKTPQHRTHLRKNSLLQFSKMKGAYPCERIVSRRSISRQIKSNINKVRQLKTQYLPRQNPKRPNQMLRTTKTNNPKNPRNNPISHLKVVRWRMKPQKLLEIQSIKCLKRVKATLDRTR